MDLAGKRALVMGLGTFGGGVGAARYAAACGARVTVTDLADRAALAKSVAALADTPIAAWKLGRHDPTDFCQSDLIVVNPAVRPNHPLVAMARESGAIITSEIELLLDVCPAQVIAVTGSNGKSTTASMVAECLRAGGRRTWLGGNLGGSLLADVQRMCPDDAVVLELSSFQLHWLREVGPPIAEAAVVTNCTPNHLDWHGNWDHYAAAKRRLIVGPRAARRVALNEADPELRNWLDNVEIARRLPDFNVNALNTLSLPGQHNRHNAILAARVAAALDVPAAAIAAALAGFRGLEHRLQMVMEADGRRFYNDSKATTPEAALAALNSVSGPVWLLLGGVDKGGRFDDLLTATSERARGAACFGTAGPTLAAALRGRGGCPVQCVATLREALAWCWNLSQAGDAIVLSPACASFDQFHNYEHRGRAFCELTVECVARRDHA